MSRAERRRQERTEKMKAEKIRGLQNHIMKLRMEGVLPPPKFKETFMQKVKGFLRRWQ